MRMGNHNGVCVYYGEGLARYGFGEGHPFGTDRLEAFGRVFRERGLDRRVRLLEPVQAGEEALILFHTREYIEHLRRLSELGEGLLDYGDTPAFPGVYEASAMVAGSVLDGIERLMGGRCRRVFVPIAGLHHARRDHAAGFCAINDCGIAIQALKSIHGLERIAYVDIDAHHGDGVFYAFESDPALCFADMHEDGRYLYPGTGSMLETGKGEAQGRKLNVPMPPRADDKTFVEIWSKVERFIDRCEPQFILLQAGADSLAGDPIADLAYTPAAHAHAARRLCALAERHCDGRILAVGGGGYNRTNLAEAWCAVVEAFLEA
jgi:acetoin utilization protein AcuC